MSLWRCASCADIDKRNYIETCMRCGGQMIPVDAKAIEVSEQVVEEKK